MKTFDHEKAWQDLALPAYKQLPTAALCLIEHAAIVADGLRQDSACNMVWPDDGGKLREMFERLDSETLASASHVSYVYNHWKPSASVAGDAPKSHGWKFSDYADQVLRARFGLGRDIKSGAGLLIHEGTIRVCYSSRDSWTWHEVAPATENGIVAASKIADTIRRKVAVHGGMAERDNAAYKAFEEIKSIAAWPEFDTSGYMVEESVLELRQAARMPKPDKAKLAEKVRAAYDNDVAKANQERDGYLWLIEHDIPTDNAIFYDHTGQWSFGWRRPYTGEARETLLKALAKFPFSYDVKA